MRKPLIAGNWKMNKTTSEAAAFVRNLIPLVKDSEVEIAVCPTAVCLSEVKRVVNDMNIQIGAQNMHHKESGAFTGEISPLSLKDLGVEFVILGHSERRQYFKETDEDINRKVQTALSFDLKPILCVGETLEEREAGSAFEVIDRQLTGCLQNMEDMNLKNLVIAYEPVWAIGTGKTATKEDANEVISYIRKFIRKKLGDLVADNIRILYGGSVKSSNIKELMSMSDIDGVLVGGASLDVDEFSKIVNY